MNRWVLIAYGNEFVRYEVIVMIPIQCVYHFHKYCSSMMKSILIPYPMVINSVILLLLFLCFFIPFLHHPFQITRQYENDKEHSFFETLFGK